MVLSFVRGFQVLDEAAYDSVLESVITERVPEISGKIFRVKA